jgi:hypothetical protein
VQHVPCRLDLSRRPETGANRLSVDTTTVCLALVTEERSPGQLHTPSPDSASLVGLLWAVLKQRKPSEVCWSQYL